MPQRFDYDRLSSAQFTARLVAIDLKPNAFARIFGVRENTVCRWVVEGNIPSWVDVALDLLELPGARAVARSSAARIIRTDNLRPDLAYPYRREIV